MDLLPDIEGFLRTHPEISATALGDKALGDRHFVRQVRNGRRVWPETEEKVRLFMATYKALTTEEVEPDYQPDARQVLCEVCDVRIDQGWPACPNADCPRPAITGELNAGDIIDEIPDLEFPPAGQRQQKAA